jgi:hypothetical protein
MKAMVAKMLEELEEAVARGDSSAKVKSDLKEEQALEHENEMRDDSVAKKLSLKNPFCLRLYPMLKRVRRIVVLQLGVLYNIGRAE